jgi:hypothetical protein
MRYKPLESLTLCGRPAEEETVIVLFEGGRVL